MIKSVVREHKWLPKDLGSLFIDEQDYRGLIYWYDDVIEMHKKKEG